MVVMVVGTVMVAEAASLVVLVLTGADLRKKICVGKKMTWDPHVSFCLV